MTTAQTILGVVLIAAGVIELAWLTRIWWTGVVPDDLITPSEEQDQ